MGLELVTTRTIRPEDNGPLAKIIRDTLAEFGANRPGTVYYDPTTDHLYEVFHSTPNSIYFIAEQDGMMVGGAGIYPTEALPEATCELVKMYLVPAARGIGLGKLLIGKCLDAAREMGYRQVYLESMPELKKALSVYEKFGFEYLDGPMGNSGHTGCDLWMLKRLDSPPHRHIGT
ncbi:MAG: family N-acetyltransferase [Chitinophagaceae bacterium]|jgi:putative acetyltransferase|nr:family N-acetyltransferase [Chitinophagaceae bacterium]